MDTKNKCIICGNTHLKKRKANIYPFLIDRMFQNKEEHTDFFLCKQCKISYFSLRPTDENMKNYYKNYMKEDYINHRDKYDIGFSQWREKYLEETFEEELKSRKTNMRGILAKHLDFSVIKNVLDYGGDEGDFILDELSLANKYIYDISGVTSTTNAKIISEKSELENYNWDLILCNNVLEHVSNPVELVGYIETIMKKGTYLYVEVPYEYYWDTKVKHNYNLKQIIKRPKILKKIFAHDQFEPIWMSEHINAFRPETFEFIFSSDKFEILTNEKIEDVVSFGTCKSINCLVKKL